MDNMWWWVIGGVAVAGFGLWLYTRSQRQQSFSGSVTGAAEDASPLGNALRGLGVSGEASGLVTGALQGIV